MSNCFSYKDKQYKVGDTIGINYKIKEGDKERLQLFKGIIIKIKGDSINNRMITVRRITRSGVGVERIIPLCSPYIESIELIKQSNYQKSKLYFVRRLSNTELKSKLYKVKKTINTPTAKKSAKKAK